MLQVIQYQKTGELSVEELPAPTLQSGGVLVRNRVSLISAGTERSSVETAQASLVGKARSRPDLVRQVMDNVKREGVKATYAKVRNRLDNYKELGYSSAGVVVASGVEEFKVGDRVACAGGGYASHAEIVFVPRNLVARIPNGISFEEAAFTTVGAIAMQGVRQADVRLGECVAVIGLGLVGLLTVQLLKAAGCRVIGFDVSDATFERARTLGCDVCALADADAVRRTEFFTAGHGADAVIIAAATSSNEPVDLAMQLARKKGKVVLVGMVGMDIPRSPFYEKELDIRMSCSYGPGRYDPRYEELGMDYPVGYVRWTEGRNMEAVLELIATRRLNVSSLVTHRFGIQDALVAYDVITGKRKEHYLAVLLHYPEDGATTEGVKRRIEIGTEVTRTGAGRIIAGFVGAGNFAQSYLLPPLRALGVQLKGVAASRPVNANSVGRKFRFEFCTTEPSEVMADPEINMVFIVTRHDSHARFVVQALKAGKNVFVEKPLAINQSQLDEIVALYASLPAEHRPLVAVGFNRRFSRPFGDMAAFFRGRREPLTMTYRVHAGFMPKSHWMQDEQQGGRFIGEAGHFIDCMSFLTGARPVRVYGESLLETKGASPGENILATLKFSDGSIGTLLYLANGDRSVGKEYMEASCEGKVAVMDNFTSLVTYSGGSRKRRGYKGGKGHREEVEHITAVMSGEAAPLFSLSSFVETTQATLSIVESLRRSTPIEM